MLFVVEHFDPLPRLKRQYLLKVFIDEPLNILDVEMIDVKSSKKFLKRSPAPKHIVREDFFVGATVLLMARELVVIDYGDGKTRERLHHQMQQTVLVVPAEHANMAQHWGSIIDACQQEGLLFVRAKSVLLPADVADKCCEIVGAHAKAGDILKSMVGVLVLCMQGEDGVNKGMQVARKFDNPSASTLNTEQCRCVYVPPSLSLSLRVCVCLSPCLSFSHTHPSPSLTHSLTHTLQPILRDHRCAGLGPEESPAGGTETLVLNCHHGQQHLLHHQASCSQSPSGRGDSEPHSQAAIRDQRFVDSLF